MIYILVARALRRFRIAYIVFITFIAFATYHLEKLFLNNFIYAKKDIAIFDLNCLFELTKYC